MFEHLSEIPFGGAFTIRKIHNLGGALKISAQYRLNMPSNYPPLSAALLSRFELKGHKAESLNKLTFFGR